MTLLCFAVKQEAKAFQRLTSGQPNLEVLLTGIGRRSAEKAIRAALSTNKPDLIISSGFAGGLRPDLTLGTIVFSSDKGCSIEPALLAAGALRVRFHCAERIATTAEEKRRLRQQTNADAVEMESDVIRSVCREHKISSATVRVILDTADEDLPLDFNQLLDADQEMDGRKLAWSLAKSPAKVGALLRLQKQSKVAAGRLAQALVSTLD